MKCLYVCLRKKGSLRRHTATTGFAGISTDAALPLSKAASVLSRVLCVLLSFCVAVSYAVILASRRLIFGYFLAVFSISDICDYPLVSAYIIY